MTQAVAGASVRTLCQTGDSLILAATAKAYNKKVEGKVVEKGVGFPTCVSVNNCICHHSPLASDPDVTLADGDLVKMYVAQGVMLLCAYVCAVCKFQTVRLLLFSSICRHSLRLTTRRS